MNKSLKFLVFSIFLTVMLACSVKKDAFLNRNFHALTTKYNVLFNGEQAYLKGLEDIESKHEDNFWKRLQIEPISFDENVIATPVLQPGTGFNDDEDSEEVLTSFDKAEEKAVKAIQKHSMNINGYEKNSQIDDAYLLLGKSRYYTQRFIPAIESFNYIIVNYPNADLINETKIWRAKTNIRLDNEKLAIESLKFLLEVEENEEELPDGIREQAHTAMAMAYEKTDTIQKVIEHLTAASKIFKNKEQSARNMFVLGQIYSELDRRDSARMVFHKLAETKKAPYKYRIRANIEMAKNTENDSASIVVLAKLKKLIRNPDNRKFLNALYYQAGVLEVGRNKIENATTYFKKSILAKNNTNYQKTYAYEGLGNIAFDKQDYLLAGFYYDSVLQATSKEFDQEKRIRRVRRKNKGLTTLRKYEDLIKKNDSILKLVAMTSEERTSFFENHIEKIKEADAAKQQLLLNAQNFGNSFGGVASVSSNKGKWYFYNTQALDFGKADFQKVWGTRPLEDNWRLSDKSNNVNNSSVAATTKPIIDKRYVLATYLDAIPTNKNTIRNLKEGRNDALYQLGLIYKEQFKNSSLAIKNLERLQKEQLNNDLELPINYHLYQIYISVNDVKKATYHKEIILTKYPKTTFAQIIKNPKEKLITEKKEDIVSKKYKEVYYLYKQHKFQEVVSKIDSVSKINKNSILIPKFALLKALSLGKYKDKQTYIKALEFVAIGYANKEEGVKAKEILAQLKK